MDDFLRHKQMSGFTLIELFISMAVLAVVVAMAVPAFSEYFERSRLRGTADGVVNFLNAQRVAAVKFDRNINVSMRGSGSTWCLGARAAANPVVGAQVPAAVACDCSSAPAQCLVEGQVAVLTGTTIAGSGQAPSIDAADIATVFDGRRGTLADFSSAGNVVLTSPSQNYQIRVDILGLGQARTCVPAGKRPISGYPSC